MSSQTREKLMKFRSAFFREKYRFDQGNAFLVFLNFSLLVISLVKQSNGNSQMISWYVLLGFLGTWILGYFLDRVVKVQEASEKVVLKRSPIWKVNFDHHDDLNQKITSVDDKIEDKIYFLNQKLDRIEKIEHAIISELKTLNQERTRINY